jgi:hypothetical protein
MTGLSDLPRKLLIYTVAQAVSPAFFGLFYAANDTIENTANI